MADVLRLDLRYHLTLKSVVSIHLKNTPRTRESRLAFRFSSRHMLLAMTVVGLICCTILWLDLNSEERRIYKLKNIRDANATTLAFARHSLTSREPLVRLAAAEALGKMQWRAEPALDDLISLLDTNDIAAPNAAWAIGHVRSTDPRAIDSLIEALESENHEIRRYAAYAIWLYGTEAKIAIPNLEQHIDDDRIAYMAARALGAMGPFATKRSISNVSVLLTREEPAERAEACDALAQLAYWHELDDETIGMINRLREDKIEFVRLAAIRATTAIEDSKHNNPDYVDHMEGL